MDNRKITDITCGILFKKSFGIMDNWGTLVDDILKSKYFSTDYFPNISTRYSYQGELSNQELGHYLVLSSDNLIYRHVFQGQFDKEFAMFKDRIVKYLEPHIITGLKLETMRIGVVYSYSLTQEEVEKYIYHYVKNDIKGINDFRFSRKEPTAAGGTLSGTIDYINKIYTVGSLEGKGSGLSYDYQHHFKPARECISNLIEKIIDRSFIEFNKDLEI